ncbi:hypothetical protein GCM10010915_28300 [Microbacterium faecale]|uniref:Uncharacterized protein n=1 Tax=Microbacterium faecale TaxID=1804630 RepID=A0A916YHV0_9MICO|nr:hypothetical protein GCM10010915_28300 [Microbacterium faecale]
MPMTTGVTASGSVRSRAAPTQSPKVTGFGGGAFVVPRFAGFPLTFLEFFATDPHRSRAVRPALR